jgi:hypothetical protein
MGIIDSKRYTLICPHCGLEESGKILDHGSQWAGHRGRQRPIS